MHTVSYSWYSRVSHSRFALRFEGWERSPMHRINREGSGFADSTLQSRPSSRDTAGNLRSTSGRNRILNLGTSFSAHLQLLTTRQTKRGLCIDLFWSPEGLPHDICLFCWRFRTTRPIHLKNDARSTAWVFIET